MEKIKFIFYYPMAWILQIRVDAAPSPFHFYNTNVPQNLSDEELKALGKLSKSNNLVVQKADNGNSLVLVDS